MRGLGLLKKICGVHGHDVDHRKLWARAFSIWKFFFLRQRRTSLWSIFDQRAFKRLFTRLNHKTDVIGRSYTTYATKNESRRQH